MIYFSGMITEDGYGAVLTIVDFPAIQAFLAWWMPLNLLVYILLAFFALSHQFRLKKKKPKSWGLVETLLSTLMMIPILAYAVIATTLIKIKEMNDARNCTRL